MKKTPTLSELKAADVELIKNRPAISVFRDNLSLGAVLEKAYIKPKYKLCKHDQECEGIAKIYREYNNKNVIFVGEGGAGKTSAFLRLYTDIEEDIKEIECKQFFYFFAPDLKCDEQDGEQKPISYKKMLREIINTGVGLNGILLLDGLEEAYLNDGKKASELLKELADTNIVFWVSCRTSFYERLNDDIIPLFAEKVNVNAWDSDDFEDFISNCLKGKNNSKEIKTRIDSLKEHAASLTERPLFATMILFVAEDSRINTVYNEYELIELFLNKWIERERREKKINFDKKAVYKTLRDIALSVYLRTNKRPKYSKRIQVFRDLLVMSDSSTGATILNFYHREFLVYFIVNALIDAALCHTDRIVWWFSQTFYDDITNLIKPVLARMDRHSIKIIYNNLFSVYRRTYEKTYDVREEFKVLGLLPEESFLKLRDEVLYFILRLPNIDHDTFVRYAYENSTDTMLFLGIAYGMAAIDPNNPYTLEFAKKLEPGKENKEEIRNRGWGMCFFGDVDGNGYEYDDSEGKPWNKIRENRLRRLSDNEKKHVTRVLDIPLLYCFYASRGFRDCTSYRDYTIIKNTDISLACFGKKQHAFMQERRDQLVSEYRKQLLLNEIRISPHITNKIQKERIVKMADDMKKTVLEIDEKLAERILKQIEHREIVCKNIKTFWEQKGTDISEKYKEKIFAPEHRNISRDEFDKRIKDCKILIITANFVEGVIVTQRLMEKPGGKEEKLDAYAIDGHLYQFAKIGSIPVLHIWPTDKSSFTLYGSFSAVDAALDRFSPKYVVAVGVAFGIDPEHQSLGHVLIAKNLVFYDSFNKVTDGKMKLRPQDTYQIDADLNAQIHQLDIETPPEHVGKFKWFFNAMLTGGTVLSDANEKEKLLDAATGIGYEIVGGEMEASGIYYACQRIKNRKIPFFIIKGICDWGAEKNGWKDVIDNGQDGDDIKDYVQAFACDNAYDAMCYIISQLNME